MSVSYSSNKVTIGTYKNGTTDTCGSNTVVSTTGVFASSDVGRKIRIQYDVNNNGLTQIRTITAYNSSTQVTVHSPWIGTPPTGVAWAMSHNLQDVHDIGNAALQKIGDRTYRWDAGWSISADGFLGDEDVQLEMKSYASTGWAIGDRGTVEFGRLWGGEANNSIETTNGCSLVFNTTKSTQSIYSSTDRRVALGGVVNYYGCSIDSRSIPSSWMFQRMGGATRFIGDNFDGIMGGRFYHEASEWVDCRHSGNNDSTPAWSLGVTFNRNITNVTFFRNLTIAKNYQNYSGTFRDCVFTDSNTNIFFVSGKSDSVVNFVDCTTFTDSDISDQGSGTLNQLKSINYNMTDTSGSALQNVKVRVGDKDGTLQTAIESSDINGSVPEILAKFFIWTNSSPSANKTPFTFRIRKYGYIYQQFDSPVADPIKQGLRIRTNNVIALSESTASALTGIAIDFTNKILTITENKTMSQIYDYCQAQLVLDVNMNQDEFLTSTDGYNFILDPNWIMVINGVDASGYSVNGEIHLYSSNNLTDMNITGNLRVNIGANAILSFNNVTVTESVFNDDTSHTLTINASNGSVMVAGDPGTGNGQTNIVNAVSLTIKGWLSGGKLVIYDDDSTDPQELGTELQRNDNITADEIYSYDASKAGDNIVLVFLKSGYKWYNKTITLGANSADFTMEIVEESN